MAGQSGEARIFLIQDDNLTAEVPLRRSILQSTLRQKYRSTGRHNPQRDGGPEKGLYRLHPIALAGYRQAAGKHHDIGTEQAAADRYRQHQGRRQCSGRPEKPRHRHRPDTAPDDGGGWQFTGWRPDRLSTVAAGEAPEIPPLCRKAAECGGVKLKQPFPSGAKPMSFMFQAAIFQTARCALLLLVPGAALAQGMTT